MSIMLQAPLLLFWFARARDVYCFSGFAFLAEKNIAWKGIISSRASVRFKLIIVKYILSVPR